MTTTTVDFQRSFEWLIGLEEAVEDFSSESIEETLDREVQQVVDCDVDWLGNDQRLLHRW